MAKKKSDKRSESKKEQERLRKIYAKSRAEFSAADLQRFTEIEDEVPIEQVLAQPEAAHRRLTRKKS